VEVRERLRSLAAERRRFGYRRLGILLEREGVSMNKKRLFPLYQEEGLAVRRRRGRKRATGTRAPMALPDGPTNAGRWTSWPTACRGAGASASCASRTTSRARPWPWWLTPRSAASAWRAIARLVISVPLSLTIMAGSARRAISRSMDQPHRRSLALHRAGQAAAERLRR